MGPPAEPKPFEPEAFSGGAKPTPHPPARGGAAGIEGAGLPGAADLEGPQSASVVIEKAGPREARVGQKCRFVLTVRNAGRTVAHDVVLTDEAPTGAELLDTNPPAQRRGGSLVWSLGSLAPGEERQCEVLLLPSREGAVGSVASVVSATRATAAVAVTRPALAVQLEAAPTVRLGGTLPLRVTVTNPGSGLATGVVLVQKVPRGMSHPAGEELEFEVGDLAAGDSRVVDLELTAESPGASIARIEATAAGGLSASAEASVSILAPALAVAVNGPERRHLDRSASYAVSVANPGTAAAKDVRLVTHLPPGLKFVRANNLGEYDPQTHAVYWSLAELPQGQRGEVELVALAVEPGEHTLRVEGEAEGGLSASEAQRLVVEGVESLAFDVRDLADPIEVGGVATYDIRVTNEGTKAASGVRVRVEPPVGMRLVGASGPGGQRVVGAALEFAPLPSLAPGEKAAFRVELAGERPGDQRVAVLVSSDGMTDPIRREESTRVFGDE